MEKVKTVNITELAEEELKQKANEELRQKALQSHVEETLMNSKKDTDDGTETAKAKARIERQDAIALVWSWEDVLYKAAEKGHRLSRKACAEIISEVGRKHDCELGVTWLTLDIYIDEAVSEIMRNWFDNATEEYITRMDDLVLDERDGGYPDFSEIVKYAIGFIPTELDKEKLEDYEAYLEYKELADKATAEASYYARTQRKAESHEEVGKAEDDYNKALDAVRGY